METKTQSAVVTVLVAFFVICLVMHDWYGAVGPALAFLAVMLMLMWEHRQRPLVILRGIAARVATRFAVPLIIILTFTSAFQVAYVRWDLTARHQVVCTPKSLGSIGENCCDMILRNDEDYRVTVLPDGILCKRTSWMWWAFAKTYWHNPAFLWGQPMKRVVPDRTI
jgi:hypothetical protein